MSQNDWPPNLKTFVNRVFAAASPANRQAVETELKATIYQHYTAGTIYTTDWDHYELQALKPTAKRKKFTSEPSSFTVTHAAALREDAMRQKRQRRFEEGPSTPTHHSQLVERLGSSNLGTPEPDPPTFNPDVIDWDKHTIVGTSARHEKPYLRLTTVPDPSTIRPLPILRETLDILKQKWRTEANYAYICDQFKSMRQDLTVQRIKNDFTVTVYEIHARIALEKGDLGEYNQCQSMLKGLYLHGLKGHPLEFAAYRILYLLHTRNRSELNGMLSTLSLAERADPGIRHALEVRRAMATSNYHVLFKRCADAPKMGAYLIDHFIERERLAALVTMTKSYKSLSLAFAAKELGFEFPDLLHRLLEARQAAFYVPAAPGQPPPESPEIDCRRAHPPLVAAMPSFFKVDLRGQI